MIRIVLLFFMFFCVVIHGSSSSQSKKKNNSNNFVIDIDKIQNTPDSQLVGTKAFAQAFTQAVHGKPCDTKFCTPAIRQRLKYLQEHDQQTFYTLINELGQANQAITHRSKKNQTKITRINSNVLDKFISPEMMKQLIKAWKNSHQQQEQQIQDNAITINDHQETIETHEGTIATQNSNLQTTRYKFYGAAFAAVLQLVGLIVMTLITN